MAKMAKEREKAICLAMCSYLGELRVAQRHEVSGADAAFKLDVHFPTVTAVAKRLFPDDYVLQTAADFHDYGRIPQLVATGSFNDGVLGSAQDHHVIGQQAFVHDMNTRLLKSGLMSKTEFDDAFAHGFLNQISQAILLHGLRGKAFDEAFAALDPDAARIVDLVSTIDDVANGTQCVGYLLRECQEQAKNVSKGGYIPDENAHLTTVSPRVMQLLVECTSFNRNAECKTYPDYVLFGMFLALRNLKNPQTRDVTHAVMEEPVTIWHYVAGELVSTDYPNVLTALEWTLDVVMEKESATAAKTILYHYYEL